MTGQKSSALPVGVPAEKLLRDICRVTGKHHSAEDKTRIVLEGLRAEESIAALCRRASREGSAAQAQRVPHLPDRSNGADHDELDLHDFLHATC